MDTSRSSTDGSSTTGRASWRASDPVPLTIPVVAQTEKRLAQQEYARAVSEAYHRVVLDLQKAYGLSLPAQWTHREFLSDFLREDMGVLTSRVARLYEMYEPVRYGTESDWTKGDLMELLHQIYDEPPMRNLYLRSPTRGAGNGDPPKAVGTSPAGVEGSPARPG